MTTLNGLFISWINYHGRSQDLANALGFSAQYITSDWIPAPVSYLPNAAKTVRVIKKAKPDAIIVMQPPIVALIAVLIAAKGLNRPRIVADLHSGVFEDPKWKWASNLTLLLLKRHAAIVTNDQLSARCGSRGVQTFTLHDVVNRRERSAPSDLARVFVPLSYANDEPIAQILRTASTHPEWRFELSGTAPDSVRAAASANVHFTGYLTRDEYGDRLRSSSVVVALTTRDNTMQRAAYEALSFGRAIVTTSFPVLQDYFQDAAEYCQPNASDLGHAIGRALADRQLLEERGALRVKQLQAEADTQLAALKSWLHNE